MKHGIQHSIISIRRLLLRTFLSFSIPALALLMLYTILLVQKQADTEIAAYQNNLIVYVDSLDRVFENTESQLDTVAYSNSAFQLFSYSDSVSAQYKYTFQLVAQFSMLQQQENQLAGILLYSADPSFYYPLWNIHYSYEDTRFVQNYLDSVSDKQSDERQWFPLALSDRIIYIRTNSKNDKIVAAIIDPSLGMDPYHSSNDIAYFFSTSTGDPLYPLSVLDSWDQEWTESTLQKGTWQQKPYYLIKQKLTSEDIYLCSMAPKKSLLDILTATEKVIIGLMIVFIFSVPFLWGFLYRQLLNPLSVLTKRMQQIADGKEIPQVSEDQPVEELRAFSKTLNYLLNNIQHLKLDAYNQKMNLLQAQLQYLHLQIRPHFYINCLKNIFSLAEEKDYEQIQKVTLSLSDYFRYIFRDNRKLIPLREELHSVKTYITLQQLNYASKINLTMDVDATAAEIPILPLSILTFVENSIKHTQNTSELNISIEVRLIHAASGMQFINTVISSNNGGFPPEILEHLKNIPEYKSLYDDYHVGISNVYYRMELTYHQKGTLEFYNVDHNSCVEITTPVLDSEELS